MLLQVNAAPAQNISARAGQVLSGSLTPCRICHTFPTTARGSTPPEVQPHSDARLDHIVAPEPIDDDLIVGVEITS
jgi:hypothetical protein